MPSAFVILGSGKTGMDAVAWLLQAGVPQQAIHWVRPRDAWLLNRAKLQPGLANFEIAIGAQLALMTAWAEASDVEDLFDRLEAADYVFRIDRDTRPSMYHYATSSRAEIDLLATVETSSATATSSGSGRAGWCSKMASVRFRTTPCSSIAPRRRSPVTRRYRCGTTEP